MLHSVHWSMRYWRMPLRGPDHRSGQSSVLPVHQPARAPADEADSLFRPQLALQPSRAFACLLLVVGAAALTGAAVSFLPLWLKLALLATTALLLGVAWRYEVRRGLRHLQADTQDTHRLTLRFADGKTVTGRYAGHALLGTLAVFIYVERTGWLRVFGPRRFAVLSDATDADLFRRLRAWAGLR